MRKRGKPSWRNSERSSSRGHGYKGWTDWEFNQYLWHQASPRGRVVFHGNGHAPGCYWAYRHPIYWDDKMEAGFVDGPVFFQSITLTSNDKIEVKKAEGSPDWAMLVFSKLSKCERMSISVGQGFLHFLPVVKKFIVESIGLVPDKSHDTMVDAYMLMETYSVKRRQRDVERSMSASARHGFFHIGGAMLEHLNEIEKTWLPKKVIDGMRNAMSFVAHNFETPGINLRSKWRI